MMKQLIKNKRFEVIKALVEARKIKQEWIKDLYSILEMEDDSNEELKELKKEIVEFMNDVKITIKTTDNNLILAMIEPKTYKENADEENK
ncbi:MAG: hypothetical protein JHC31_07295 [Sulfurihydrogenibium sp.]|nr:hypothetical protein [Sulfurihydrogenibium sp.]